MLAPNAALTPALGDLLECEAVIERAAQWMLDCSVAVRRIKERKLYRAKGFTTWEAYCTDELGWSPQHANRIIEAGEVVSLLALRTEPTGSVLPERESQVRPLTLLRSDDDKRDAWAEAVESAEGGQPTAAQVEQAVAKRQPPKKDHPAPFSDPILAEIAEHLPSEGVILDPFAGTGRIHELATEDRRTVGIEIEAEWADKHVDTIHGDALAELADMADETFDAIATSPTYGNRMADHHDAKDDSVRLTYKHTLGHDLADTNTGAMQWGPEYRAFHEDIWAEAVRVLRPGGSLTINVKNHVRNGVVQRVVEWHIATLIDLGLDLAAIEPIPTKGLMAGANADTRTGYEFVVTLNKPVDQ